MVSPENQRAKLGSRHENGTRRCKELQTHEEVVLRDLGPFAKRERGGQVEAGEARQGAPRGSFGASGRAFLRQRRLTEGPPDRREAGPDRSRDRA